MKELMVDTDLTATLNQIDSLISDQSTDGVIYVGDIFNTPLITIPTTDAEIIM
jgi:hypothetical protein